MQGNAFVQSQWLKPQLTQELGLRSLGGTCLVESGGILSVSFSRFLLPWVTGSPWRGQGASDSLAWRWRAAYPAHPSFLPSLPSSISPLRLPLLTPSFSVLPPSSFFYLLPFRPQPLPSPLSSLCHSFSSTVFHFSAPSPELQEVPTRPHPLHGKCPLAGVAPLRQALCAGKAVSLGCLPSASHQELTGDASQTPLFCLQARPPCLRIKVIKAPGPKISVDTLRHTGAALESSWIVHSEAEGGETSQLTGANQWSRSMKGPGALGSPHLGLFCSDPKNVPACLHSQSPSFPAQRALSAWTESKEP